MIIECSKCHTQARLPDSKEGAKVRCSECGHVYVARPVGTSGRAARKQDNSMPIYLAVGAGLLLIVGMFYVMSDDPEPVQAVVNEEPEEEAPKDMQDAVGWNSPAVKLVRDIHRYAYTLDDNAIRTRLDAARIWKRMNTEPTEEELAAMPPPAEGAEPVEYDTREWSALAKDEQSLFLSDVSKSLFEGEFKSLIADWEPYDGNVIEEDDEMTIVRVSVSPKNPEDGIEKRTIEWKLSRDGSRWLAWSWARYYTQAELSSLKRKRNKKSKKVKLSDGSVVYEAEPGPIGHFEDTPADLRKKIDEQYAKLIDLELRGPDNAAAKAELVAIGRPALPVLLTGLYLIPLDTEDNAIKVNLINQSLEEITGFYTGFKPMLAIGSGVGTSEERRQSAIKQWFGWYYRKAHKFTENTSEDLIDSTLTPRNAREQREYEKALREQKKENPK